MITGILVFIAVASTMSALVMYRDSKFWRKMYLSAAEQRNRLIESTVDATEAIKKAKQILKLL